MGSAEGVGRVSGARRELRKHLVLHMQRLRVQQQLLRAPGRPKRLQLPA